MVVDGKRYARPTSRDCLSTAETQAVEAARCLSWVCSMLGKAGEDELAAEARELKAKVKALSARVSARYYGETTDGK